MFWPSSCKEKKSLGYSDLKINLPRCHARSGTKPKTAIGLPWVNSTSEVKEVQGPRKKEILKG